MNKNLKPEMCYIQKVPYLSKTDEKTLTLWKCVLILKKS